MAQGAAQEGVDPFAELAMSARSSVAGALPERGPLLRARKLCCGRDCAGCLQSSKQSWCSQHGTANSTLSCYARAYGTVGGVLLSCSSL